MFSVLRLAEPLRPNSPSLALLPTFFPRSRASLLDLAAWIPVGGEFRPFVRYLISFDALVARMSILTFTKDLSIY